MFPVHVSEIVRATRLAIRRRRELLGPTCKHDPADAQCAERACEAAGSAQSLVASLDRSAAGRGARLDGQLPQGGEHAGAFDSGRRRVRSSANQHRAFGTRPPGARSGRLSIRPPGCSKKPPTRPSRSPIWAFWKKPFARTDDSSDVGREGHLSAVGVQRCTWAKQKGYRQLHASLATLAAENLRGARQTPQAACACWPKPAPPSAAATWANGAIGARTQLCQRADRVSIGQSRRPASKLLAAVWKYQQYGFVLAVSYWPGRSKPARRASIDSDRIALQLYEIVLRDPTPADWASSPMESITVLTTPHPLPYEHWFETAMQPHARSRVGGRDCRSRAAASVFQHAADGRPIARAALGARRAR